MKELLINNFKNLLKDEDGQGMVEYGLILALIAVVTIVVLTNIGTSIESKYQDVDDALQ